MELLRALESIRTPFLDTLIGLVTRLGEETLIVAVVCLILWCVSKKTAYIIGVSFFLSGLMVQGLKIIFRVPRPWVIDPSFTPVYGSLDAATGYSFPSGHTQAGAALWGSLGACIKNRPVKAVCFLIALLIAFSRIYLGVHVLLDVVVSLVISFVLVFAAYRLIMYGGDSKKKALIISLVKILFAIAVIILAAVLYTNGTIEAKMVSDCLKAAGASIGFAIGMYVERVYIKFSVKSKSVLRHAVKYILGLAGVIALQEGLKPIIGTGLAADTCRYFLMLIWVTLFYPLIIKRFFQIKA